MSRRQRFLSPASLPVFLFCSVLLVTGCVSREHRVPVASAGERTAAGARYHMVKRGETLYSIAWTYGLDYRRLAAANSIGPPFTIYVDQKLKLPRPGAREISDGGPPQPPASASSPRKAKPAAPPVSSPARSNARSGPIKWHWPIQGKVVRAFDAGEGVSNGIDIEGRRGQPVASAAGGVVVYAGGGLRGYGKLIIVKHNDTYLSAYGHNRVLLVKEGQTVKGGQVVAEVGANGAEGEMLHFEIRRNGKPENPLDYLPRR